MFGLILFSNMRTLTKKILQMKKSTLVLSLLALGMALFGYVENRKYHKAVIVLQKEHVKINKILKKILEIPSEGHSYLEVGTPAPEFSLADANGAFVTQNTSDKANTLLVFSNKNCHYCEAFYPVLDSFANGNPEVSVLVLQGESNQEMNKTFLDTTGYNFKMLVSNDSILDAYKIDGTPTCVYLDSNSKVLTTFSAASLDEIRYAIAEE